MEDGKYCLVLVFEAKALQLSDFEKRQVNLIIQAYKTQLYQVVITAFMYNTLSGEDHVLSCSSNLNTSWLSLPRSV